MNTIALLRENPDPTDDEIRAYLAEIFADVPDTEGQLRGIRPFWTAEKTGEDIDGTQEIQCD